MKNERNAILVLLGILLLVGAMLTMASCQAFHNIPAHKFIVEQVKK